MKKETGQSFKKQEVLLTSPSMPGQKKTVKKPADELEK